MLYIVATPIGNLDDITFRAVDILKSVDIILAEDTQHSKRLLSHYNITTRLESFYEHNENQKTTSVVAKLLSGKSFALISDAGTPTINDPGYVLVCAAKKAGVNVVPIPGACALISALSASGIASNNFSFFGFLPNRRIARVKFISTLLYRSETIIFYESPKRILATMLDLQRYFGNFRKICIAKEISKSFETIKNATLPELITYLQDDKAHQKGEFVVLISGWDKKDNAINEQQLREILTVLLTEMGAAKAAKLAAKIVGIDKKYCYQIAINL